MTDFVISVPTDLAMPLVLLLLVVALAWLGLKARRLPRDMANGIAAGLTRFAKVNSGDENYAEHYAQLSACIFEAWEKKDPVALLPLVGNPIAIKAWNNLAPMFRKFTGFGGNGQEAESNFA